MYSGGTIVCPNRASIPDKSADCPCNRNRWRTKKNLSRSKSLSVLLSVKANMPKESTERGGVFEGSPRFPIQRKNPANTVFTGQNGEIGIRTLDTDLTPYNGLANRRLQPLGHLSRGRFEDTQGRLKRKVWGRERNDWVMAGGPPGKAYSMREAALISML
jgi:hypothetical protein